MSSIISESHGDLNLTLDCAQATFVLEDTLVISLKSGDLYVLTLIADSMRSIRSFHFDKVAASVLTTCVSFYCKKKFLEIFLYLAGGRG